MHICHKLSRRYFFFFFFFLFVCCCLFSCFFLFCFFATGVFITYDHCHAVQDINRQVKSKSFKAVWITFDEAPCLNIAESCDQLLWPLATGFCSHVCVVCCLVVVGVCPTLCNLVLISSNEDINFLRSFCVYSSICSSLRCPILAGIYSSGTSWTFSIFVFTVSFIFISPRFVNQISKAFKDF